MLKLHNHLLKGIEDALFAVLKNGEYADKYIPKLLKANPKWGSKDRRFVAENSYDIIRYYGELNKACKNAEISNETLVKQLVLANQLRRGENGYINSENEDLELHVNRYYNTTSPEERAKENLPEEIWNLGIKELGPIWELELAALNLPAPVYIRKVAKLTAKEFTEALTKDGIVVEHTEQENCFSVVGKHKLEETSSWKAGKFEIQDKGSQLIAQFLNPETNSVVIDACCGAGGKTMHIADIINKKGTIHAFDIEQNKLTRLNARAKRSNIKCIQTALINDDLLAKFEQKADYLLLDVPCSGVGVWKRQVDAKWKLKNKDFEDVLSLQYKILNTYSNMLKIGGKMVYATCSIFPSENELQIQSFLAENKNYKLLDQHKQLPSMGTDGFYMAKFERLS